MRILQNHYELELETIEKEILEIQSNLTPFSDMELLKNNLQMLKTSTEILNRDLI